VSGTSSAEAAALRARRDPSQIALRAGVLSVAAGAAIMAAKFAGWLVTGSSAVFADAAESIVNVIAGAVATYSVAVASRPADADHPYGHGKAESVSAAVEGSLILLAATLIMAEALREILVGPELRRLGTGIAISAVAALGNLVLGLYLVRTGKRVRSEAIEADGHHVLTDVWTTFGTIAALGLVQWTGIALIDPFAALAVALNIVVTGWRVVRRALGGLLDRADFELLSSLAAHLEAERRPEWVDVHELRSWSSGKLRHFDVHLAVPRYLTIEEAHRVGDLLEHSVVEFAGGHADAVVHLDPCRPRHCTRCSMSACPVRAAPLEAPLPLSVETITRRGVI
jgi:cation diffusion facilitator family transporter